MRCELPRFFFFPRPLLMYPSFSLLTGSLFCSVSPPFDLGVRLPGLATGPHNQVPRGQAYFPTHNFPSTFPSPHHPGCFYADRYFSRRTSVMGTIPFPPRSPVGLLRPERVRCCPCSATILSVVWGFWSAGDYCQDCPFYSPDGYVSQARVAVTEVVPSCHLFFSDLSPLS